MNQKKDSEKKAKDKIAYSVFVVGMVAMLGIALSPSIATTLSITGVALAGAAVANGLLKKI